MWRVTQVMGKMKIPQPVQAVRNLMGNSYVHLEMQKLCPLRKTKAAKKDEGHTVLFFQPCQLKGGDFFFLLRIWTYK
jgi:hypothetical protein